MDINSLRGVAGTSSATAQTASTTTAATDATPLGQALKKAGARVQSQIDTTGAQISAFGKLKAAVSDTQLGARALVGLPQGASAADTKTATQRFVEAFNATVGAAQSTDAAGTGADAATSKVGALGRKLLPYTAATDGLRRIGIRQEPDGRLTFDAKKFEAAQKADPAAVQRTLAALGQAVDKSASGELASTGKLGASLTSLNQRSKTLLTQQNALQAIPSPTTASTTAATATTTATAANSTTGSSTSGYWRQAIAAYAAKL